MTYKRARQTHRSDTSLRSGVWLIAALVALSVTDAPVSHATSAEIGVPQTVSGASPFPASCTPSVQPLPSDAPSEPRIAVDARDPHTIVIAYGQLPSVVTVSSRDGGSSWTQALPPGLSRCTGGVTDFTGDPFVSIGIDGTVYLSSVPVELPLPNTTLLPRSWIAVNRSTDHGASWSAPVMVAPADGSFWDKGSVLADPLRPGVAYEAFLNRSQPDGGSSYLAVTHDGGQDFTAPLQTIPDKQLSYPHDPQILVLPDGTLVQIFVQFNDSNSLPTGSQVPVQMMWMRSPDGGAHWSVPAAIAQSPNLTPTDPDTGQQLDANDWPSSAVAPDGTIYVVWADIQSASAAQIVFSKSVDGARSWTLPAPVAKIPAQAWIPTVAVGSDGTVGVTWYDARNDRHGDGQFTTDVWFAHSHDAGASWEQAHLAGPFDFLTAGRRNGRPFLGDYFGLAPVPGGFVAAFDQAQPQSNQSHSAVFFDRISTSPPATIPTAGHPTLTMTVTPRHTITGRRTRVRFTVRTAGAGKRATIVGASIRFAGRTLRTGRRGHAALTITFRLQGRYRATATKRGYSAAQTIIRVQHRHCRDPDHDRDCDRPRQR